MSENNLNSKSLHYSLMLFLKAMQTNFLQQDNAIFYHFFGFYNLNYILTYMHVLILQYKMLRAIDLLFDSDHFQSFLCNGKFISFHSY